MRKFKKIKCDILSNFQTMWECTHQENWVLKSETILYKRHLFRRCSCVRAETFFIVLRSILLATFQVSCMPCLLLYCRDYNSRWRPSNHAFSAPHQPKKPAPIVILPFIIAPHNISKFTDLKKYAFHFT